ncbi:unnamed protein product [Meloidogyne enterolobii]|uniref:Uncharacterized protein n=1 Tax=Meloidogyne enterolobii TaxID=390850 RepID=A0ACB1A766_MELEN
MDKKFLTTMSPPFTHLSTSQLDILLGIQKSTSSIWMSIGPNLKTTLTTLLF